MYPRKRKCYGFRRMLFSLLGENPESRIQEAVQKERKRISADLHDGIGPVLSALRLKIECIEPGNSDNARVLEDAKKYLQRAYHELQEIVEHNNITGNILQAIRSYLSEMSHQQVILDAEKLETLPPSLSLQLYRIIQEAIHNAIKHSGSRQLYIHISTAANRVFMVIADAGKGFTPGENPGKGNGLSNLQRRTSMLGGSLHICSRKNKGTQLYFLAPIKSTL